MRYCTGLALHKNLTISKGVFSANLRALIPPGPDDRRGDESVTYLRLIQELLIHQGSNRIIAYNGVDTNSAKRPIFAKGNLPPQPKIYTGLDHAICPSH